MVNSNNDTDAAYGTQGPNGEQFQSEATLVNQNFTTSATTSIDESLFIEVSHQQADAVTGAYEISFGPQLADEIITIYLPTVFR